MKVGKFTIDGEKYYNGFSLDQKWNGFEVPYFVYRVAVQILEDMKKEEAIISYRFNKAKNEFVVIDEYDEPEIISMCSIQKIATWPIGGNAWAWIMDQSSNQIKF